jgi:putative MATE family efflux protein
MLIAAAPPTDPKISYGELWHLSWPMVLSMFLLFSVGLADVYVAGKFEPEVQGAVGFAGQLLFFFGVLANSLGVGLAAIISRQQGAADTAGLWHTGRQGVLLATLVTLPLALLGMVLARGELVAEVVPPGVARVAGALLPYYAAALWPQALITIGGAIFRARTRMLLILLCSGSTALLNLGGNFLLAFGFGVIPAFGPQGIALATCLSSLAGAALTLIILGRQGLFRGSWAFDWPGTRRILKIGWPIAMLQMGWSLGGLVLYAILGHLPTQAVAATAALTNGLRIEAILYLPVYALNMITAVLVAQAMGGGEPERAEQTAWKIGLVAAAILALVAVPVFIFSREIAGLITPDPTVRELTHLYLRFNMLSQPFMALGICLGGALEGAGDTFGVMKLVLVALWLVRLPVAAGLALATALAATGVWLAMVLSIILQCWLLVHRFRQGKWKGLNILGDGAG